MLKKIPTLEERAQVVKRILDGIPAYPFEVLTPFSRKINPVDVAERMHLDFLRLPQYSTKQNRWRFKTEFDMRRFKKEFGL